MDIEADFYSDYTAYCEGWLRSNGFEFVSDRGARTLIIQFLYARSRVISPKPRRVHLPPGFAWPTSLAILRGFLQLIRESEAGQNLNSRQSKWVLKPGIPDALFNDWGITHFHLGLKRDLKDSRFIERTKMLLFALVNENAVYGIFLREHGSETWGNQEMFEILHEYFPETISHARLTGASNLSPNVNTSKLRTKFRKAGLNMGIELKDGTIYVAPNGGYTTDGTSSSAVREHNKIAYDLKSFEDSIRQSADSLVKELEIRSGSIPDYIEVQAIFDDGPLCARIKRFNLEIMRNGSLMHQGTKVNQLM